MQIADCLSRNSQRDSEWREDDEEIPAGIIKSEGLFVTKSSAEMLVVQLEKGLSSGEILAAHGAGGQDDGDGSDDGYEEPAGRHDLPDSLRPQPITQKQMLQAQQKCDFCRGMIRDLEQETGGSGKDRSSRYWAVFDGVLHRVTEASDARGGYDSARPFVP